MIFDTHAHYDDEQFDTDRDALLRGMAEQNVGTIINVGASLEGCWRSVELAHQYPFVYAAVGIHPDEVGDLNEESFARLRETARMEEKVVAIGEIGLDYHWDVQPHEVQKYWFVKQMELAKELDLPIAVHSRDAAKDTFDLIAARGKGQRGVIHCYSYSPEMAQEYVKLGYHIGLGGVVTFKNAKKAKLTSSQFYFDARHPYANARKKLPCLKRLPELTNDMVCILKEMQTVTIIYKLSVTNLEFTLGLTENTDVNGKKINDFFLPMSLRVEDTSVEKSNDGEIVDFIFSKDASIAKYDTLLVEDKNKMIPDNIKHLISEKLYSTEHD